MLKKYLFTLVILVTFISSQGVVKPNPSERRLPEETCWKQTRQMFCRERSEDCVVPTPDNPHILRIHFNFESHRMPLAATNQVAAYVHDGLAQSTTLEEVSISGPSLNFIACGQLAKGLISNSHNASQYKRFSFLAPKATPDVYTAVLQTLFKQRNAPMECLELGDKVTDDAVAVLEGKQAKKYPPKHLIIRGTLTDTGFESLVNFVKGSKGLQRLELRLRMRAQGIPEQVKDPLVKATQKKKVSLLISRL